MTVLFSKIYGRRYTDYAMNMDGDSENKNSNKPNNDSETCRTKSNPFLNGSPCA